MSKVAVITGGSSGIGKALVDVFAENGYRVYEISRRESTPPNATHISADITNVTQVRQAFDSIKKSEGKIDLLINNAGYGISGAAEFAKSTEAKRLFDVNFFGTHNCIKAVVPMMRQNKGGRIINVSSVAAVYSIPFQSFYSASKAAVNSLTLALANELKAFGISVCAVMPGDSKTGFTGARTKNQLGDDVYGGRIASSVAIMEHDERNGMPPETIAAGIYKIACKKRVKPLYTIGVMYKLLVVLQKILPVGFANRVVGMLYIKSKSSPTEAI